LNSICLTTNSSLNNEANKINMFVNLHPKKYLYGHDAQIEDVWQGVIETMKIDMKNNILILKQMPGIESIDESHNWHTIVNAGCIIYNIVNILAYMHEM
jgi:hypothetical protein